MPALNRIATVSGSSTQTINGYAPFAFSDGYTSSQPASRGEWSALLNGVRLATPTIVSALAGIDTLELDSESSLAGTFIPGGNEIALTDDRGLPLITWTVSGVIAIRNLFNQPTGAAYAISGSTVLRDGPLDANDVHFGFDGSRIQVSETTTTNKRVWCEQLERGSSAGLLVLDGGTTDVEAANVNATFRLNYDPAIGNPSVITDDLGRTWDVFSVSSEQDRRYLRLEGSRAIIT